MFLVYFYMPIIVIITIDMDITGKIKNILSNLTQNSSPTSGLSGEFLRHGGKRIGAEDWSRVEMSDIEFYTGYSYAAINNRANKVAQLAEDTLKTDADQKILDAARKKKEGVVHPYITLIDESDDFTNYQFWYDISTYLDLEGVYYLMAVRNVTQTLVGDIQYFKMLNPYDITPVRNQSTFEIGGYIETRNGMQRTIPAEMIIPIRKSNPFSADKSFAMTDAAKDAQFTMKQAGNYTRSSLKNNLSAPGILSTGILMDPENFANFKSRVQSQEKGMPLFANGAGAIDWKSMQIDMDKAALSEITNINRDALFAVSGVSKTTMGIEESGTTRETSKTQKDKFIEDHIMPQVQLILDALNQDYKKYYKSKYKNNKYRLYLDNPLGSDKDAEIKDLEISDTSYKLYDSLVADGYDREIAAKFAQGEIGLEELGEPTNEPRPNPVVEAAMLKAGENPQNPNVTPPSSSTKSDSSDEKGASKKQDDKKDIPTDDKSKNNLNGSEENEENRFLELFSIEPSKDIKTHSHFKDFKEDLKIIHNQLTEDDFSLINKSQGHLQNAIQNVESQLVVEVLNNVFKVKNKFDNESEILSKQQKEQLIKDLQMVITTYYLSVFPIYGSQLLRNRSKEFGDVVEFKINETVKNYIRLTATRASQSHIDTITADILKQIKKTYQEALEDEITKLQGEPSGSDQDIYKLARERALSGASQQRIISEIKDTYGNIARDRAKTIARTETNRAFTQSQFQADVQFLKSTNLMDNAYKVWQTRSDNPCQFCLDLESRGPVPFDEDFVPFGTVLEANYVKKNGETSIRKLPIDYEPLTAGNAHVNCGCIYKLVIKNDSGEFVENKVYGLIENGGPGSGNFGHGGRPGKIGGSSKTGGSKKLSQIEKIKSVEDEIRNKKFETFVAVDLNGNVVLRKDGNKKEVVFSPTEIANLRAAKGVIFTHNHPSSSSFSANDISFGKNIGAVEVRVASAKYDYSFKPSEKPQSLISDGGRGQNYPDNENMFNVYQALRNEAYSRYMPEVEAGRISVEEAMHKDTHYTMTMLAKEFDATYIRTERS